MNQDSKTPIKHQALAKIAMILCWVPFSAIMVMFLALVFFGVWFVIPFMTIYRKRDGSFSLSSGDD